MADDRSNTHLLSLINKALREWQIAEELVSDEGVYTRISSQRLKAEKLKQAYIDLLKEAKKRNLSLTTGQMIERIMDSDNDIV